METLAAFGCVEPATARRAMVEVAGILTILLAELGVELLLLLRTLGSEVSVRQRTRLLSFPTVFAFAFAILTLAPYELIVGVFWRQRRERTSEQRAEL